MSSSLLFVEPGVAVKPLTGSFAMLAPESGRLVLACKDAQGFVSYGDAKGASTVFTMDYGTFTVTPTNTKVLDPITKEPTGEILVNYSFSLNANHEDIQSLGLINNGSGQNVGELLEHAFTFIRQEPHQSGFQDIPNTSPPSSASLEAKVNLQVTGTNDAPTITFLQQTNSIVDLRVEEGGHKDAQEEGKIVVDDKDATDNPTLTIQGAREEQPQEFDSSQSEPMRIRGTYGDLTVQADGTYIYELTTYIQAEKDVTGVAFDQYDAWTKLTAGQKVTETFTLEAVDDTGAVVKTPLVFTVFGKNDAPSVQVHTYQSSLLVDEHALGLIVGDDAESAANTLKYALVNDIGTRYAGKVSGTSTIYTTEYGVVTVSRVTKADFEEDKTYEANKFNYKYSFTPNYEHPHIQALDEGENFILPFYVQSLDAQNLASEVQSLNIAVQGQERLFVKYTPLPLDDTFAYEGTLIAAGLGRDRYGEDISSTSPKTAYAGLLSAKGSFEVHVDAGEVVHKYALFSPTGESYAGTTRGATSTYVTEYGTMVITKTAAGANYTFTLNKNSDVVKALDHNDSFTLPFHIVAEDANGLSLHNSALSIALVGTNDAPVMTIIKDSNDVTVNANTHLYDTFATGKIVIQDGDHGDNFMQQTLTGSAKLVPHVVAQESSDAEQAQGNVLVVEGKYGTLTVQTNGNYTYALAKDGEQKEALDALGLNVKAVETFTLTTTDSCEVSSSQSVAFTVIGANDRPVVVQDTQTSDGLALHSILAGVGRERDGEIIDEASRENIAYKAVTVKGFIAVQDDVGDSFTPVLYIGGESYQGTNISTEEGRFVFARATVEGKTGFTVSFTPHATYAQTATLEEGQTQGFNFQFAVKDKVGLESAPVSAVITFEGSNQIPKLTLDLEENQDLIVYAGDAQDSSVHWQGSIVDVNANDTHSVTVKMREGETQTREHDADIDTDTVIVGKYGNVTLNAEGEYIYELADPDAPGDQADALNILTSSKKSAKEIFDVTIVDDKGASSTQTVTVTVYGEKAVSEIPPYDPNEPNSAPYVTAESDPDALIMSGVGRHANGADAHTVSGVSANTAYKGDFTSKGSLSVKDDDKDVLSYGVQGHTPSKVSGNTSTYNMEEGTLVLTKTGAGVNYSFTLTPEYTGLKALAYGEEKLFTYVIEISDGRETHREDITFTAQGSNDAPEFTSSVVEQEISLGAVQANKVDAEKVEHAFTFEDVDQDETVPMGMSITLNGKTASFADVHSLSDGELLVEGTYGNVYYEEDKFIYKAGVSDAQKIALQLITAHKEVQDNFSVTLYDQDGGKSTQIFKNTLVGSDIPRGETLLELNVVSSNTFMVEDGVGRDSKGNDITTSTTLNHNMHYGGDVTSSGTVAVHAKYRDEPLRLDNDYGDVVGNTTTFVIGQAGVAFGSLVFTKIGTGYSYVFTINKEIFEGLKHGEEPFSLNMPVQLGDSYVRMNIPFTIIGTNDAPEILITATDNDYAVLEGELEPTVTGFMHIRDPDNSPTSDEFLPQLVTINGQELKEDTPFMGMYGGLELTYDATAQAYSYTYTLGLGMTEAQENALKAHDNYDVQHDVFTIRALDDRGAETVQEAYFTINRQGTPVLGDVTPTMTQDVDLDGTVFITAQGSLSMTNREGVARIDVVGDNGIVYDFAELEGSDTLESLKIDGKYGTFSNFAVERFDQGTADITYTYTQYVDVAHGEASTLTDSLDVSIFSENGVLFGREQITHHVENLADTTNSLTVNEALSFTSVDADKLFMPGTLASNRAYGGDILTTGKLSGTAFTKEAVSFEMYDEFGNILHSENHGIYTKFFSDYGVMTLTKSATGMNSSFTLNKEYAGFKELPQDFVTSFPFILVAKDAQGVELGREDLGVTVRGTNDAPELSLGLSATGTSGRFEVFDADADDSSTFTVSYGSTVVKDVQAGSVIQGKYGALVMGEDGAYEYVEAVSDATDITFSAAQIQAYGALSAGQSIKETFYVTATDKTGAFEKKALIMDIVGVNDALVLKNSAEDGSIVKEHDILEPGAASRAITGFFEYTDFDKNRPVFDVNGDVTKTVNGNVTTFAMEYGTLTLNTTTLGRVNYSFKLNDKAFEVQKLAVGEELEISFPLQVSDGIFTAVKSSVNLDFTVKGSNDVPIMTHIPTDGMLVTDALPDGMADGTLDDTVSGVLTVQDVDLSDMHTFSISSTGKETVTSHSKGVYTMQGTYGTLTLDISGEYNYTLGAIDSAQGDAVAALADGVKRTESFTVKVADGSGGFATKVLTFTTEGSNQAPVVSDVTGESTVYASGVGREVDGAISSDAEQVYTSKVMTGQILVSDVDKDALKYVLCDAQGNAYSGSGTFVTEYGTVKFTSNKSGASYTFTINNKNEEILALQEDASLSPFTVKVVDSKGAEVDVFANASDFITIVGTNNVHELDVEYSTVPKYDGIVTPQDSLGEALLRVIDADAEDYTYEGKLVGADDMISSSQEDGTLTLVGKYGSAILYTATGKIQYGLIVNEVDEAQLTESFLIRVTDSRGIQREEEVSFTIYSDAGAIPPSPILDTIDSSLIAAGVGRDSKGNAYEDGTVAQENAVYKGDFVATGVFAIPQGTDYYAVYSVDSDTQEVVDYVPKISGTTYTYTSEYGTLVLTKSGNNYNYKFTMNAQHDMIQAVAEGQEVTLPLFIQAVNERGFAAEGTPLGLTFTGSNDRPVLSFVVQEDVIVDTSEAESEAHGQVHTTDPDASDFHTLHGISTHAPSEVAEEEGGYLSIVGKYGTLSILEGEYTYSVATEEHSGYDALNKLALGAKGVENFTITTTDFSGATDTKTINFTVIGSNDAPQVLENHISLGLDLNYILSGVGRDRNGKVYEEGTAAQENAVYTAKAVTGFIAVSDPDTSESFTPVFFDFTGKLDDQGQPLYEPFDGITKGNTTTFDAEEGKYVFTKASKEGFSGFNVTFTPYKEWLLSRDNIGEDDSFAFVRSFGVQDKAGLLSEPVDLDIHFIGSNDKPEFTLSMQSEDVIVHAGTTDSSVLLTYSVEDADEGDSYSLLVTSTLTKEAQSLESSASEAIEVQGKYGVLHIDPATDDVRYVVDNTLALALASSKVSAKESFSFILTDAAGANVSKTLDFTVFGENRVPVVSVTDSDTNLIAAGVGRDKLGRDEVNGNAVSANSVYAGDVVASGTIKVTDADKDMYDISLANTSGELEGLVKGSTITYTLDEGLLVLTKTATGYSYKFTMNKEAEIIKALQASDTHDFSVNMSIIDAAGNEVNRDSNGQPLSLDFTIKGTNDAPIIEVTTSTDFATDMTLSGLTDTQSVSTLAVSDAEDDALMVRVSFGKEEPVDVLNGLSQNVVGDYGILTIGEDGTLTYTVNDEAVEKLGKSVKKESFTITATDEAGAVSTEVITYTVRGNNTAAPEITEIRQSDAILIDDGFGREANGADSAVWNKAYKGDFVARGSVVAKDSDGDVLSYTVQGSGFTLDTQKSTATVNYFNSEYGVLSITNKGAYTFTMSVDHEQINALAQGEFMYLDVTITAHDARGDSSTPEPLQFTIKGTDNGPSFALHGMEASQEADFTVEEVNSVAQGKIIISDVDDDSFDGDSYTYGLAYGKVLAQEEGTLLRVQGKYGVLLFDISTQEYTYTLNTEHADYVKLNAEDTLKESFVLSATDPKGIVGKQDLIFTLYGVNEAPTLEIKPTTAIEMDYAPNILFRGSLIIDDLDLDGDTLRELQLDIGGTQILTTKNGTTKILIQGEADGDVVQGELSVTISGNNCSYTFKPLNAEFGLDSSIPVKVTDIHGSSVTKNLEFSVSSLHIALNETPEQAFEGGAVVTGSFADMSTYAKATWADVEMQLLPLVKQDVPVLDEHGRPIVDENNIPLMEEVLMPDHAWEAVSALPADVNGMGKPDAYFSSEYGDIAFFYTTGKFVFTPAADGISEDKELLFGLAPQYDLSHNVDDTYLFALGEYEAETQQYTGDVFSILLADHDEEFFIPDAAALSQGVQGASGDDFIHLEYDLDIHDVLSMDGGEGMDVLLTGISNLDTVKNSIDTGDMTNIEVLVGGDVSAQNTQELLERIDFRDTDKDGMPDLEEHGWTKNESAVTPQGYVEYENKDEAMTILVQQTLLTNS